MENTGQTLQVEAKKERKIFAGIDGLNTLIENGIPNGYSIILQTPSGPERDLFIAGFIKEGFQAEGCVIVTLSMNSPDEFKTQLSNFGLTKEKIEEYESKGNLRILDWYSFKNERIQGIEEVGSIIKCSKALTNVEIAINKILRSIDGKTTRAIIDVLSPALKVFDFETVYKFAQTIRAKFKKDGVTALFIIDKDMHETRTLSSLHRVFDGVIDIERERIGNKLSSRLGILSMSGTFFVPEYRELKLTKEGLEIITPKDVVKIE
ncbi:MAG: RAD55 family ATPase, partial [Thermoplasmata archaeon]